MPPRLLYCIDASPSYSYFPIILIIFFFSSLSVSFWIFYTRSCFFSVLQLFTWHSNCIRRTYMVLSVDSLCYDFCVLGLQLHALQKKKTYRTEYYTAYKSGHAKWMMKKKENCNVCSSNRLTENHKIWAKWENIIDNPVEKSEKSGFILSICRLYNTYSALNRFTPRVLTWVYTIALLATKLRFVSIRQMRHSESVCMNKSDRAGDILFLWKK